MTISELRKNYPFITYGGIYEGFKKHLKYLKWLIERLKTERPTSSTCHEWRGLYWRFKNAVSEFDKAIKGLPKPTAEQKKEVKYDVKAPWPDDHLEEIDSCVQLENAATRLGRQGSALLIETQYDHEVLGSKMYDSIQKKGYDK